MNFDNSDRRVSFDNNVTQHFQRLFEVRNFVAERERSSTMLPSDETRASVLSMKCNIPNYEIIPILSVIKNNFHIVSS